MLQGFTTSGRLVIFVLCHFCHFLQAIMINFAPCAMSSAPSSQPDLLSVLRSRLRKQLAIFCSRSDTAFCSIYFLAIFSCHESMMNANAPPPTLASHHFLPPFPLPFCFGCVLSLGFLGSSNQCIFLRNAFLT